MFDLIDECGQDLKQFGYTVKELGRYGITLASLHIENQKDSQRLGLEKGDYYIFSSPFFNELGLENCCFLSQILADKLKEIFVKFEIKRDDKILFIGLGNPDIDSDKLGKVVFDNLNINPLKKDNNFYKFCPNIFFSTGIDTLLMIKMLVKELKIDLVIIVDSLTTSQVARLGRSFQVTTSGMTPGSGVNRFGNRICKETVGAHCISIGVPFMIFSSALNGDKKFDTILSPKDIKENVDSAGIIIAKALSEVIQ